jgi:indole-3-glycerol phosphate synthase
MSGFLPRMLQAKETEVALKKDRRPLDVLREEAAAQPVRDFASAIAGGGRIIAEIKRRSPSRGAFRQQAAPEKLAEVYAAAGAAAISVVTDETHFGTRLADVSRVRRAVNLPVLAKDFFVDPYQLVEARAAGADAVLLIVRILSDGDLSRLLACSRELGAAALVECHDATDLRRAVAAGAGIIGINNRNLDSMEVSIDTCRRLAREIPGDILRVAESGISRRETIRELTQAGMDAFLIGSALLDAPDPGLKLEELLGDDRG